MDPLNPEHFCLGILQAPETQHFQNETPLSPTSTATASSSRALHLSEGQFHPPSAQTRSEANVDPTPSSLPSPMSSQL